VLGINTKPLSDEGFRNAPRRAEKKAKKKRKSTDRSQRKEGTFGAFPRVRNRDLLEGEHHKPGTSKVGGKQELGLQKQERWEKKELHRMGFWRGEGSTCRKERTRPAWCPTKLRKRGKEGGGKEYIHLKSPSGFPEGARAHTVLVGIQTRCQEGDRC